MKRHLPSRPEMLELLALALMVTGIQWAIRSWGWSAFFALGFVWNWAVLNGWVSQQVSEKRYRYSLLRGISATHRAFLGVFEGHPRWRLLAETLPAGLMFGLIALTLDSPVPWWAAFLGSGAFLLIRRQLLSLR
jgi:hypothetical protein